MRLSVLASVLVIGTVINAIISIGCGGSGDELVYFPQRAPNHLNPILDTNEEAKYLCELIFDGLVNKTFVGRDGREHYEWALVTENGYREESPSNRQLLTIYLRMGVRWHDRPDHELKAEDVIYTLDAIRASNSPLKGWLNTFVEWVSLDPEGRNIYKFCMKLKVERSKECFMELFSPLKIIPKYCTYEGEYREMPLSLSRESGVAEEFKFSPIGTGPYMVHERPTVDTCLLHANESENYAYLGLEGQPYIKAIRMVVEDDPFKAVKELKEGFGLVFDVKQEHFRDLKLTDLKYADYHPYSFYAIVFNMRGAPFNDPNLRAAVSLATDKKRLAGDFIFKEDIGDKPLINTGVFPASSSYVMEAPDEFRDANEFSLLEARKALDRAGSAREFELLICPSYSGAAVRDMANSFSDMMKAVGIKAEAEEVSAPIYDARVKERQFEALVYRFEGFDSIYDLRALFGTGASNLWGLRDDQLENDLDEFGRTLNWEKRVKLAVKIHTRVNEIVPGCFLFTVPRRAYYSPRLDNVTVHPEVGFSTVENWRVRAEKE